VANRSSCAGLARRRQTSAKDGERPIVFDTDEDVNVLPTSLKAVLAIGPYPAGAAVQPVLMTSPPG